MSGRSFFVRFNESFIRKTENLLDEDDLRKLSTLLCDDPFGNDAHESIENLYVFEWKVEGSVESNQAHYFWYIADPRISCIEVIAYTTQKDDDHDDPSSGLRAKKYARILTRLLYAGYRIWQWWNDDSGGPDFGNYGP